MHPNLKFWSQMILGVLVTSLFFSQPIVFLLFLLLDNLSSLNFFEFLLAYLKISMILVLLQMLFNSISLLIVTFLEAKNKRTLKAYFLAGALGGALFTLSLFLYTDYTATLEAEIHEGFSYSPTTRRIEGGAPTYIAGTAFMAFLCGLYTITLYMIVQKTLPRNINQLREPTCNHGS
jgi:hypothetical protein